MKAKDRYQSYIRRINKVLRQKQYFSELRDRLKMSFPETVTTDEEFVEVFANLKKVVNDCVAEQNEPELKRTIFLNLLSKDQSVSNRLKNKISRSMMDLDLATVEGKKDERQLKARFATGLSQAQNKINNNASVTNALFAVPAMALLCCATIALFALVIAVNPLFLFAVPAVVFIAGLVMTNWIANNEIKPVNYETKFSSTGEFGSKESAVKTLKAPLEKIEKDFEKQVAKEKQSEMLAKEIYKEDKIIENIVRYLDNDSAVAFVKAGNLSNERMKQFGLFKEEEEHVVDDEKQHGEGLKVKTR